MLNRTGEIGSRTGFRRYLANTSWLIAERLIRLIVSFLIGIYVARYLGPMGFGELSFAQSFVGLFAVLATLGLDALVVRELVNVPERRASLLGTAFTLKLFGSVLTVFIIGAALSFSAATELERWMVLIIASGLIFQSANIIDLYFQSRVQSRYVVQAQSLQLAISSIAKLLMIWEGAGLIWFAVVGLIDSIILACGLVLNYFRATHKNPPANQRRCAWQFDWRVAVELLREAWPLIASGVAISVYMKIDQVMIREMLSASDVGQYAAAVRVSEAWYFIPVAITQSVFPAILSAKKQGRESYLSRIKHLYSLLGWSAIVVALTVSVSGSWLIEGLYGVEYHSAAKVLSLHVWAAVFVGIGVANSKYLLAEGLSKFALYNTSAGAIANVFLNLWLIPAMGISGAALATVIAYALSAYVMLVVWRPTRSSFFAISLALVGRSGKEGCT